VTLDIPPNVSWSSGPEVSLQVVWCWFLTKSAALSPSNLVTVKWNKNTYEVSLTEDEKLQGLRDKLRELTNVPDERQKIMFKGKFVKDDAGVAGLPDGAQVVLTGTADALQAAKTQVIFAEDLSVEEKSQLVTDRDLPGYKNLGNTCYMNSTLQCLRAAPELREALATYTMLHPPAQNLRSASASAKLTLALDALWRAQAQASEPVVPLQFLLALRNANPQFAEMSSSGVIHAQQDAEECLNQIWVSLAEQLKDVPTSKEENLGQDNWVDILFSGESEYVLRSEEAPDEPPIITRESFRKLRCPIGFTTSYLVEGLREGSKETLTKMSPSLGRNALYTRTSHIVRLPKYLTIQFMRFFWRTDNNQKTKVVRKVQFPFKLDMLEFTGGELKESLTARRQLMLAEEEAKLGIASLNKPAKVASPNGGGASAGTNGGDAMTAEEHKEPKDTLAEYREKANPTTAGYYELFALVTHKGREADSGHYVGWTKHKDNTWIKYDDADVKIVPEKDIEMLCGGGDWHMAYLAFYKRIDEPLPKV